MITDNEGSGQTTLAREEINPAETVQGRTVQHDQWKENGMIKDSKSDFLYYNLYKPFSPVEHSET